jgi:hypothetical protein
MVAPGHTSITAREGIRDRIVAIERDIDEGRYVPGPWQPLLRDARALPRHEREPLAEEFSRVSRKLHQRGGRYTVPLTTGMLVEIGAAFIGAVMVIIADSRHSNLFAIIAAILWTVSFQPLLKMAVGYMLGVEYEYAYFYGVEPRFKMRMGDYIAAPRWARVILHLSGTVGSPLGAWLPTICIPVDLWFAIDFCWVVFWIVVAINIASFIAALAGLRRLGPFRASDSSGGSAALELREGLEI